MLHARHLCALSAALLLCALIACAPARRGGGGGGNDEGEGCESASDCDDDLVCRQGTCTDPSTPCPAGTRRDPLTQTCVAGDGGTNNDVGNNDDVDNNDTCVPDCREQVCGPDPLCGESCGLCPVGEPCEADEACRSGSCVEGACAEGAACTNTERDPAETDVDCGGPDCRACATGQMCQVHEDCLSRTCLFGVCRDPACDDELQNGSETGVDCGGPCEPCEDGALCDDGGDCTSGTCDGNVCVSCGDGDRNGDESDVDCGGSCPACGQGESCGGGGDCTSGRCEGGACATCRDGVQSGQEVGVDCGGPCAACGDGDPCTRDADCASGVCGAEGTCIRCGSSQHVCERVCVESRSVETCGGRCSPCPTDPNGTATCDGDSCGLDCDGGHHRCGDACEPDDAVASCGDRCTPCPAPDNGEASCVEGRCVVACAPGFHRCGDACTQEDCGASTAVFDYQSSVILNDAVMTLDANDRVHLLVNARYSVSHSEAWHVVLEDGEHFRTVIDEDHGAGVMNIVIDGSGEPHVLYRWFGELFHASAEDGWNVRRLHGDVGFAQALAVGPSGEPSALYFATFEDIFTYRYRVDGSWRSGDIDPDAVEETRVDLEAAPDGTMHAVYRVAGGLNLAVEGEGGEWAVSTIDLDRFILQPDLEIDAEGGLHAAWFNEANRRVVYGRPGQDGWNLEATSTESRSDVVRVRLALDEEGVPHVAYRNYDDFYYAQRTSEGWHEQLLFTQNPNAYIIGFEVDSQGRPVLGWYDALDNIIRVTTIQ